MKVLFNNQVFLVGNFTEVIDFLRSFPIGPDGSSRVVLPCSLNDLAMIEKSHCLKKRYHAIDYLINDSMWLTFWFRLKYHFQIDRLYGPTLMRKMLDSSDHSHEHFFLASDAQSMKMLKRHISEQHCKLLTNYSYLPRGISQNSERQLLQKIIDSSSTVIWIGIGSPKQVELAHWMKNNSRGKMIFCVGAAFDFISGRKKQAPSIIQKSGFEWLFRLLTEPKRLWKRYLIDIPLFLLHFSIKKLA